METLNIEYVAIDQNSMTAKMPVNESVFNPTELHGGATLALAESVGSAAAQVLIGEGKAQIRVLSSQEIMLKVCGLVTSGQKPLFCIEAGQPSSGKFM